MPNVWRNMVIGGLLFALLQCQRREPPPAPSVPSASPPAAVPEPPTPPSSRPRLLGGARALLLPAPALVRAAADRLLVEDAVPSAPPTGAPISLTASDGTGLLLVRLKASAVVQGPLAFTELHLHFQNPEQRQLEGRFSIVLPAGAAISRFAMLLPTGWQEAEVVERKAAQRAYEDFLHRRQDPALLEHEAGNQFSARVFPIPPGAIKELKISYSQELAASDELYRLPLTGLPQLRELSITAIAGDQVTEVEKRDFRPQRDFLIKPPDNAAGRAPGLRSDELAVARVRVRGPDGAAQAAAKLGGLLVLFDTSASRAPGFASRVHELAELLAGLSSTQGGALPLSVACFDQSVEPIYQGPLSGFGQSQQERILKRAALGASNLEAALGWAKAQKGAARLVLLSDGVLTAGATDKQLGDAVAALKDAGIERLDLVLAGGIRDEAAMARLVSGHLPKDGLVIDSGKGSEAVLRRLQRPTLSGVQVAVAGAYWVYPTQLDGVQPGDELLVYAEFPDASQAPAQSATVTLSGPVSEQSAVALYPVTRPLLERSLVRAYLSSASQTLQGLPSRAAQDVEQAAALRKDIAALSTRFRVLTDQTALLVLETEGDYARFGIDRKALADILTVGERGIELLQRRAAVFYSQANQPALFGRDKGEGALPRTKESGSDLGRDGHERELSRAEAVAAAAQSGILGITSAPAGASVSDLVPGSGSGDDALGGLMGTEVGDAYGAGGFGLVGSGRGGGGTGEGTIGLGNLGTIGRGAAAGGLRGRRADASEVVPGTAEVRGSLDRELIRRIIRRHLNEVRFCYERELTRIPGLQGRVLIQFTIGASGDVMASIVQSSTLGNPSVEQCIAGAVRRWQFPQPAGGIVVVTYPFVLQSGDGVVADSQPAPSSESAPAWNGPDSGSDWQRSTTPAYTGKLAEVMQLLLRGQTAAALALAQKWREGDAGDILALVALGESLEASGDTAQAARAYGSIIDLFPSRADMRRFAGERLERLGDSALPLVADTYARALEQRPDHPASHRLRAYALLRQGDLAGAFAVLETGATRQYPPGRFAGVDRILREDLTLVGAAWARKEPLRRKELEAKLATLGLQLAHEPSLRFILVWETDANDVDFHIHDGRGGHAFYSQPSLASGGNLYADVTTGYGPECFTIPGKPKAFPYKLEAHYYSRGPMGYGMGKLEILQHDGQGNLKFVERPFVVMNDHAFVDLGSLKAPL